jgi:arabinose-5-phosphate isomerase
VIITDGDLRRMLSKKLNLFTIAAKDIMNSKPKKIAVSELAVNALKIMQENNISQLIVMDNKKYLGIIHMQTLLKEGLI